MNRRRLNEDIASTISGGLQSLLGIPIVKDIVKSLGGDDSDPAERSQIGQILRDLSQEQISLKDALSADTDKRALVVGSSQAGIIGPFVMHGLEARGFKSFNFGSAPVRTMRLVYTSVASGIRDRDEYDVIIIFAGYRAGGSPDDVIDIIDLFTPSRCFVVIPPPVTEIEDTLEASRSGINDGRPVPPDYWFVLRGGKYSQEREQYCNDLEKAVTAAGATPINPRNVVPGGDMQASGVAFPNSPDGIHASSQVNQQIAAAVVEAVFNCELTVPAVQVAKKFKSDDIIRTSNSMKSFASAPALSGLLGAASGRLSSKFGMRNNPVTHLDSRHEGIDIAASTGTPVKAALSGRVTRTTTGSPTAGNYVEIAHDNGDVTRYLHLDKILVNKGQMISTGETIGLSGATGHATGPHLHWETWHDGGKDTGGVAIDPLEWLQENPDAVEPIKIA